MGVGAETINSVLGSHTFWLMVLLLCFVKIFATSMTLGSGGSGGIFAPSLFVGAMLGACFGHFAHLLLPDITASPGTYALIAMGGLVAGSTRAPITAIITIFEMTKENAIILPLMITCIISTIVSSKFSRESIYTLKLLLRNINVRGHAETNVMKSLFVKDVYSTDFTSVSETRNFNDIVSTIMSTGHPFVSVHDRNHGFFIGTVSINDVKDVLFHKEALMHICIAGDMSNRSIELVEPDDNCSTALKKMRKCGQDCLPVMDPRNDRKQIGVIWLNDILGAYDKELEHIDLTSGLAEKIVMTNLEHDIRFLEGYVITEFKAPRSFVGRSIKQLQVRNKFGVDILSIKSHAHRQETVEAIPRADTKIKPGDTLVVAGKTDCINQVKNLS
jgi:CIC family chloride channel protein